MKRRGMAFLNPPGQCREAAIGWEVPSKKDGDSGFIVISDCSRKVSLDLSSYDAEDVRSAIYKVDTLIRELGACRMALENVKPPKKDSK